MVQNGIGSMAPITDPWSHSPVPPLRTERPFWQGPIPWHFDPPKRDLRIDGMQDTPPDFGMGPDQAPPPVNEMAIMPCPQVCDKQCLGCTSKCGKLATIGAGMHLCSRCDFPLFKKE